MITIHGVHGFKGHYFRRAGVGALQQLLQVFAVVVAEDDAFGSAVPDALNHGGVVPRVGVDLTPCADGSGTIKARHLSGPGAVARTVGQRSALTREHFRQREEGGVVCNEAGGEDQRRVLLVQLGQLPLQTHVVVTGP